MKCSEAGYDLIKSFEGLSLEAYPDPASGGEPWTIGYGHTGGVKRGDTVTEAEADELLRKDVARAERCLANSVKGVLTQGQIDACCSFIFNLGCGNFGKSTLLKCINAGDDVAAAAEFGKWVRGGGKIMAGLVRRRQAEVELFLA